jgi:hypothetical protein
METLILAETTLVIAGADTHADTIHIAAITVTGAGIGDREFPATRAGYAATIRFLASLGHVQRIGVEGTASYGAGLTRALTASGIEVVEVTRAAYGVGADTAAQLLITAGANPHRLHSEAAFCRAVRCGSGSRVLGQNQPAPALAWR